MAYAGLTAAALGISVGIVTSAADSIDLSPLAGLTVVRHPSAHSTSFQNRYGPEGRVQTLLSRAENLTLREIPDEWHHPTIAHLSPIAREVDLALCRGFPHSFVGLTPQGLMRDWDQEGRVSARSWEACADLFPVAEAVVLSIEDLELDWQSAERMAEHCQVLVVTTGREGARFCVDGKWHRQPGIAAEEVDPTGAGDIFAALFFWHYKRTGDAARAAEIANYFAAASVSRPGLDGVPKPDQVAAGLPRLGG